MFDAHADILTDMYIENSKQKTLRTFRKRHWDKYQRAGVAGSIFVNYTNPFTETKSVFTDIFEVAFEEIQANQDILSVCHTYEEYQKASAEKKIAVFLGIEGAKFVENLEELQYWYNRGVRHISLTWNEANQYGGGAKSENVGLTKKGVAFVKEIQRLGMILDLAHTNEQTFYEILEQSKGAVIISHTGCKSVCNHPRNVTDEQLKAVKARGGVVGIAAAAPFLSENKEDWTVQMMAKHVDHAIQQIGIEHVGLGLDVCFYLNNETTNTHIKGFEDIDLVHNLYAELEKLGYTKEQLEYLQYRNFERILKECLGA